MHVNRFMFSAFSLKRKLQSMSWVLIYKAVEGRTVAAPLPVSFYSQLPKCLDHEIGHKQAKYF